MPAKHKAAAPKKHAEPIWIVVSNGAQMEVTADDLEVQDNGVLLFTDGGDLTHAFAPGNWSTVVAKKIAPAAE